MVVQLQPFSLFTAIISGCISTKDTRCRQVPVHKIHYITPWDRISNYRGTSGHAEITIRERIELEDQINF